jgi:hypothetical protein
VPNILDEGWPGHGTPRYLARLARDRRAGSGEAGGASGNHGYPEFCYAYSELFGGQFFPQISPSRLA